MNKVIKKSKAADIKGTAAVLSGFFIGSFLNIWTMPASIDDSKIWGIFQLVNRFAWLSYFLIRELFCIAVMAAIGYVIASIILNLIYKIEDEDSAK